MKKAIMLTATIALALSFCTAAFAANASSAQAPGQAYRLRAGTSCTASADGTSTGGNGVCRSTGACKNFADTDGDGICDTHGSSCTGFVDADKDGVCDNRKELCAQNGNRSTGCGSGSRSGGHCGRSLA